MVMGEFTQETDLLVIGGGPGGYAAAFRAADLGLDVTLVDSDGRLGGVCLFRGCIPSKTLLYVSELIHDSARAKQMGVTFGTPHVDLQALRDWKNNVIGKLADGLTHLGKKRGVQVVNGKAHFESSNQVHIEGPEVEISRFTFRHAIIATGSEPIPLPGTSFTAGGRILDSTGALALIDVPERLLIVGGGYVGMELGSVYASLGSAVTVVEMADRIMLGADADLIKPLRKSLEGRFAAIYCNTKVEHLVEKENEVEAELNGEVKDTQHVFDRVLVAIGRIPNSQGIGLENTRVKIDGRGFIAVDDQRRTADQNIFAIGDVVGGAMLAHKAMYEGKVAAEVIAGEPAGFDVQAIPAVVFTDPQVAWCGLTEEEAKKQNRAVKVSRFPWAASGRAVSLGVPEGMTKIIIDEDTERILGMGIVGREAGEMIAEGVLAIEMGAQIQDLALSMHPHPTLSEAEEEAAGAFLGAATHIFSQPKK